MNHKVEPLSIIFIFPFKCPQLRGIHYSLHDISIVARPDCANGFFIGHHKEKSMFPTLCSAIVLLMFALSVSPDDTFVAVASNVAGPMQRITQEFEPASGHELNASVGATAKLCARIQNRAPGNPDDQIRARRENRTEPSVCLDRQRGTGLCSPFLGTGKRQADRALRLAVLQRTYA